MQERKFHFSFPWIMLYIAILIPAVTYAYSLIQTHRGLALWISSPFNVFYESTTPGAFFFNYAFVVIIYLFVELYTRNIADLKGRDSLIRNAFLFSILASYIVSAVIWNFTGFPSSGTSIMAFNILLFSAFETYDSELIRRMSERREQGVKRILRIASLVFVILVIVLSLLLFMYLNGNEYWYVHILGAVVFLPIYSFYLFRYVRPAIDRLEEKVEKTVEKDLEVEGEKIEEEVEKVEDDIKRDLPKGKKHA